MACSGSNSGTATIDAIALTELNCAISCGSDSTCKYYQFDSMNSPKCTKYTGTCEFSISNNMNKKVGMMVTQENLNCVESEGTSEVYSKCRHKAKFLSTDTSYVGSKSFYIKVRATGGYEATYPTTAALKT